MSHAEYINEPTEMFQIWLEPYLSWLAIRSDGGIVTEQEVKFSHKDYVIVQPSQDCVEVTIDAENQDLRIFLIELLTEVDYPLYRKPR